MAMLPRTSLGIAHVYCFERLSLHPWLVIKRLQLKLTNRETRPTGRITISGRLLHEMNENSLHMLITTETSSVGSAGSLFPYFCLWSFFLWTILWSARCLPCQPSDQSWGKYFKGRVSSWITSDTKAGEWFDCHFVTLQRWLVFENMDGWPGFLVIVERESSWNECLQENQSCPIFKLNLYVF